MTGTGAGNGCRPYPFSSSRPSAERSTVFEMMGNEPPIHRKGEGGAYRRQRHAKPEQWLGGIVRCRVVAEGKVCHGNHAAHEAVHGKELGGEGALHLGGDGATRPGLRSTRRPGCRCRRLPRNASWSRAPGASAPRHIAHAGLAEARGSRARTGKRQTGPNRRSNRTKAHLITECSGVLRRSKQKGCQQEPQQTTPTLSIGP